jgi:hypothetical protein
VPYTQPASGCQALHTAEQQHQQQPPYLSMDDLSHRFVILLAILANTNNTPALSGF